MLIQVDKNEDNAVVCITDSGSGFSDSVLSHGTEQFFMGDTSRNRKNHYGLGLFISDCIIKQHNGTMKLSNDRITKGAKITINIPLIKNN